MKRIVIAAMCGLLIAAPCRSQSKPALVTVTNPMQVSRPGETVEVRLRDLTPITGESAGAGFVVTVRGSASPLISQVSGGELLFQHDFAPGERREFIVKAGTAAGPQEVSRVAGMFVLPREDYAWENDRIAYRMYGPALASELNNGIDVWTKRVRTLVVAKWYGEAAGASPGQDPYHHDRGEGADFFDVGRSLGAGGCALWEGGRVHQPGVFSTWETIAGGPLRTEFELTYNAVEVGGVKFTERVRIALDAGENLNRVSVTFDAPAGGEELRVASGLVKRPGTVAASDSVLGWMSLWGATNADPVNGSLGTGIVFPRSAFLRFADDSIHCLLIARAREGKTFTYYAGAGWTRSGDFASGADWNAYLARKAALIASPLAVSCSPLE
jgi:pectinesterase